MTLREALTQARQALAAGNIEDCDLEAEVLLRHGLGIDRIQLYLESDRELSPAEQEKLREVMERRLRGEPSPYITGHREFYGLDFLVDTSVLIPRPETELLVEKALELAENSPDYAIADVGTGCGAVAISLASSLPKARVYAIDVSPHALSVARRNCQQHAVQDRVTLLEGDLLSPLPEAVHLVVANLPYVRESELPRVNTAGFEPSLALDGGTDGLAQIRRLCAQAGDRLRPSGSILLEVGQGQSGAVAVILGGLFPSAVVEVSPDLSGIDRVVRLSRQAAAPMPASAGI